MWKKLLLIADDFRIKMNRKNISAYASSVAFFIFLSLIPMLMTLFGVCVLRVVWVTLIAPMKPDVSFMLLSYPITWSFTYILFIIYYFKGGWLERCERKAGYAHVDGRV